MSKIIIGTRGSELALWQANKVAEELKSAATEYDIDIRIIKTQGDRDQNSSLTEIGGQGIFTKQIEEALLQGDIHIAVHSLKDLPSTMPEELRLAAVLKRGAVNDVLISNNGYSIDSLPEKAVIGSGSIRRRALLLSFRPDIIFSDLRGNIHTRLEKVKTENLDAIMMAEAALRRLEINSCNFVVLDNHMFIPSVGQGAIGIQMRAEDRWLYNSLMLINHADTYLCVLAERSFLKTLDSGCQFPLGAHATAEDRTMIINGFVSSPDGKKKLTETISGIKSEGEKLGHLLAQKLINKGAMELINYE